MNEARLVVLSQNAWGGAPLWGHRRERLAHAIATLGPDVVGLQEIHASTARGDESQAHELAELAGGYDAWFAPGRVTASGHAEGVALLVKRPSVVLERTVLRLSLESGDLLEGPHQRVVLRASVQRSDTVVEVLVTHLSLSRHARERTAPELCAFAAREQARSGAAGAVLLGDFNATPREPALDTLAAAGWIDAWEDRHPGARGGTWPAGAPLRRIDYVWVQPGRGWQITECQRTAVSGSDHVGLIAELRWPSSDPGE